MHPTCGTQHGHVHSWPLRAPLRAPLPDPLSLLACTRTTPTRYPHRGFLVDSGRRFVPVPLLKSFIDQMSYSKVCGAYQGGLASAV
jgi:N-acetyl-beta-hexosaminidase